MNIIKSLAKQTAVYGVSSVLARILNFMLVPLFTYVFSPNEYGIVSDLYSLSAILFVILTYGMETSFFRFFNLYKKVKDKVLSTCFSSLLISSLLFLIISLSLINYICEVLEYQDNKHYIIIFILILFIDTICIIPFAYLRTINKHKLYVIIRTLNICINILFNLIFILLLPSIFENFNPDVGFIFLSNLIASISSFIMVIKIIKSIKFRLNTKILSKILPYSFPILIAGIAATINESIDKQFLKYLSDPNTKMEQIGIYGACYKFSVFMILFIQSFRMGGEPFFFAHFRHKNAKKNYANIMNFYVGILCFIFVFICSNLNSFKYFIPNQLYWSGLDIVPILLIANIFLGIYLNLSIWYKLSNKTQFAAYISIIGALITIIVNIYFIPQYGYLACAYATLLSYASMAIISFLIGQRHYFVPYSFKIIIYILSSSSLGIISHLLFFENIFMRIISVFLYLAIFVILEKNNIKSIIYDSKNNK